MTHVPYKGMGPAVTDLIAGHVDVLIASAPSMLQQVKSGKVRGLGVTTLKAFADRARPAAARGRRRTRLRGRALVGRAHDGGHAEGSRCDG